jgi:hypothetical protein
VRTLGSGSGALVMVLGGAVQDEPPRMLALGSGSGALVVVLGGAVHLGSGSGTLVMVLGGAVQDEPPLLDDSGCGATIPATQPPFNLSFLYIFLAG